MRRSEIQSKPTVKPYDQPTGGWGSMKSLLEKSLAEKVSKPALMAMLARQNKSNGFMCVSCSWTKPGKEHAHVAEFCENGAKATIWEMTEARTGHDFFAEHRVGELLDWTDFELEKNGRLTSPMRYDASLDQYVPVSWESAFAEIGLELRALEPDSVVFYASGRASLETSFMYQLLARIYGNQNLPDSSNMCHESTSVRLPKSIGSPVGTIVLEDFDHTDMMFFFGHNTGTNAPRLLHPLQEVRKRGCPVVTFNPVEERGLMRFKSPQNPAEMLSPGPGTKMSSNYFQIRCGGDIAAMTGIAKTVFALDDEAVASGGMRVVDVAFIEEHCHGFEEFESFVRGSKWSDIERRSGLSREDLEGVGRRAPVSPRRGRHRPLRHGPDAASQRRPERADALQPPAHARQHGKAGRRHLADPRPLQRAGTANGRHRREVRARPAREVRAVLRLPGAPREGQGDGGDLQGRARRLGEGLHRTRRQFRARHPRNGADGSGLAHAAPPHRDRHEAQSIASHPRRGHVSPALPRAHRTRPPGDGRPVGVGRGFHRDDPRLVRQPTACAASGAHVWRS